MKMLKNIVLFVFFLTLTSNATILDDSFKIYPIEADSLFMSAISAINQSGRYKISEIQTKNGYILFANGSKKYLLTLTKRYKNQTEIKILPQNSDYSQGATVANTIFNLIDLQLKQKPMELVK